jgi:transcriptional regulator with XRE-family HTH domain
MHGDGWELVRVYPAHRDGSGHGIIMDDYRAAVVAYLRRVKDESGLSLNEVAQRVGVSHTTLTRPLNNPLYKYVPKFATLQRIALATGIELPGELTNAWRGGGRYVAGGRSHPRRPSWRGAYG